MPTDFVEAATRRTLAKPPWYGHSVR